MKLNKKNIEVVENLLKNCDDEILINRVVYKLPKKNLIFIQENNYKFSKFVNEAIEEKINIIKRLQSGKE